MGASGQEKWVTGSDALVLASESALLFQEVQYDRGLTGSLALHGRRGSGKDPKYPRRILVEETLGPRLEG